MRTLLTCLVAPFVLVACVGFEFDERTPREEEIAVSYRGPSADGHKIRRVVVIPFQDLSRGDAASLVQSAFATEFQKRHEVEVVGLGPEALTDAEEEAFFESGTVRQDTVVRMIEQYRADAVVYGVVTRWRPYSPPELAIRVTMVSGGAGDVVWASHGVFDTNDARVMRDVHNFHDTVMASTDNLEEWRRVLNSPRWFASYCCSRLVQTF